LKLRHYKRGTDHDNDPIIVCARDSELEFWDINRRRKIRTYRRNTISHQEPSLACLCELNDGRTLVSGDENGAITMWDLNTFDDICYDQKPLVCVAHDTAIVAVIQLDNGVVVSGSMDAKIVLWSVKDLYECDINCSNMVCLMMFKVDSTLSAMVQVTGRNVIVTSSITVDGGGNIAGWNEHGGVLFRYQTGGAPMCLLGLDHGFVAVGLENGYVETFKVTEEG